MQSIYRVIQKKAVEIASHFPAPEFYQDYRSVHEASRVFYKTDPIIGKLKSYVESHIENDFGHGMNHVVKVTIDAGTLVMIEAEKRGYSRKRTQRFVLTVQCAGLLHDIKRKQKNHAIEGSRFARQLLQSYPLDSVEIEDIRLAIRNHEAFKSVELLSTPEGALISDCLYDADKFRWGPDNFTETIWDMLEFSNAAIEGFIHRYPVGVEGLSRIKETFRTPTGKKYGPGFIDLGIAMGQEIYHYLKKTYG
ncbi:MAG: HD domain-containing protein [Desulfobacterales bacterium]